MNPHEDIRFEELVSTYLDATLSPEQEFELLQKIESPAYARLFMDLVRINGEIVGLVSAPVADEKMADLVNREITRASNRQSNVCNAIMDAIHKDPSVRGETPEFTRVVPLITKPTFPWAIAISIGVHAALIMLIIGMHFFVRVEPAVPAAQAQPLDTSSPLAKVEAVTGNAFSIENSQRKAASAGNDLAEGQALETVGSNSAADLKFADGTVLVLNSDTRVRQMPRNHALTTLEAGGKKIYLERGTLRAQVARQPEGAPMSLVTSNAEATIVGTRFVLTSTASETRLDVSEGVVRLTRLFDHKSILVSAGEFAVVTPGVELAARSNRKTGSFVMGVNFYGSAVNIEGNTWMSQADAQKKGLSIKVPVSPVDSHIMNVTPIPSVDPQTRNMLNSRHYAYGADFNMQQTLPNGEYDVFMWFFEPAQPNYRSFDVELNGTIMDRGAGKMKVGEWKKAGPYRTKVDNGVLAIRLRKGQSNPAISGMAIFSVESGN